MKGTCQKKGCAKFRYMYLSGQRGVTCKQWRSVLLQLRCPYLKCVFSVNLKCFFFEGSFWQIRTKGTKGTHGEFKKLRLLFCKFVHQILLVSAVGIYLAWHEKPEVASHESDGCYFFHVSLPSLQPSARTSLKYEAFSPTLSKQWLFRWLCWRTSIYFAWS